MENFDNSAEITKLKQLISNAATSVRTIAHNLNPPELNYSDFSTAVTNYCSNISTQSRLKISVDIPEVLILSKLESLELYSAVKELIHNIVKHANASQALVKISQSNSKTEIIVKDNGEGYQPIFSKKNGNGLKNLQHRMDKLNGTIEVKTDPQEGTRVRIVIISNGQELRQ